MQRTNYLSLCTGITVSTRLHNIRVLMGLNHTTVAVVMPEIFAFFFLDRLRRLCATGASYQ